MHCNQIQTKKGKVWFCMEYGPGGKQVKRHGKTKKEAKKRVEEEIKRRERTGITSRQSKKITFNKFAEEWLKAYALTGVKRGSVRVREKEINILNKYFSKTPVAKITHLKYQDMLNDLSKKEYEESTISGVNTCAGMIFKFAKRNKLIEDNPRDGAIIPKKRKTINNVKKNSIENKYMESEELSEFLNAVIKIGLELDKERFYTLAFSGMRPGELVALKKHDIDFKNKTINIDKTLYNENNNMKEYELTPPKNNGSYRVIGMDEKIIIMLKKLIHNNDVHKMKYRNLADDFHDQDFVFQRKNGYPFLTKNLATRMKRILKYTGIEKKLTPHSFRHTHISMLTESGVDLPTIMQRVGHEDPDTTLKIYTHVTNKMKLRSVEKVTTHHSDLLEKITF